MKSKKGETDKEFLDQYNHEIDKAETEIESGDYVDQDHVEKLFANRRKNLNGD